MGENQGIKETQEVIVGALKLTTAIMTEFKDGVQAADFAVLLAKLQTEPLKSQLLAAYRDVEKVPGEVSDISVVEAIGLIPVVMPEIIALANALRKAK